MMNGRCSICGEWDVDDTHECPPGLSYVKQNEHAAFASISNGCPWRSLLKCTVLHTAGRYATPGGDGCSLENCAVFYWLRKDQESQLIRAKDGLAQAEAGFVDERSVPEPSLPLTLQSTEKQSKRLPCWKCGGKGEVSYYFDAGDHFGGSPAPGSGWETEPCPVCNKKARL